MIIKLFLIIVFFSQILLGKICHFNILKEIDLKEIDIKKCNSIFINIKSGDFNIISPLIFNLNKVDGFVIKGEGQGISKLFANNKKGVILINLKTRKTIITIENLSIYSKEKGVNSAISIIQPHGGNQHRRNVILRGLEISNFKNNEKNYFKKAIFLKGVWRPLVENVLISGFFGPKFKNIIPKMETCFYLEEVYSPTIINSRCWSSQIGLSLISKLNPGSEGLMIQNSKFVENLIAINIDSFSQEPEGFISHNHINAFKIGINIKNRKFLNISNNLFYRHKFSNGNKYIDIKLDTVLDSIISGNIFHSTHNKPKGSRKEIFLKNSRNNIITTNIVTKKSEIVYGNKKFNKIINNFVAPTKPFPK